MSVLECEAVAVGRGRETVLSEVEFALTHGERLALIGPNASGKTTLLRALAGLDPARRGSIRWDGAQLPSGAARVRTLGVLFQNEPPSRFTVRELITLGLGLEAPPSHAAQRSVARALARGGLERLADRPCTALSGGELQRALLARALVAGPKLLLIDEPSNHLDPARQAELLAELERLRTQIAVVLATHDLALAAGCDRVALLAGGRIQALAPAREVLTPEKLEATFGVRVRVVEDPAGGPPFFRVSARAPKQEAA